jgi:hypothetical protein
MPTHRYIVTAFALAIVTACSNTDDTNQPTAAPTAETSDSGAALSRNTNGALAAEVRTLAAGRGITPLESPPPIRASLVRLGAPRVRQGTERQSRYLLHDLSPAPARDRRRAQPFDRAGGTGLGPDRTHLPGPSFLAMPHQRSTCTP